MPLPEIDYIRSAFPELPELHAEIRRISPSGSSVIDAVISVIIGQMLSRKAAQSIRKRAFSTARLQGRNSPAALDHGDLRACGLSNNKIKAIHTFYQRYQSEPNHYEDWKKLDQEQLSIAVSKEWGMATWTASILAIFHFGQVDVYPVGDATLAKAENKLRDLGIQVDPNEASPYKSYLALYLWVLVDEGLI